MDTKSRTHPSELVAGGIEMMALIGEPRNEHERIMIGYMDRQLTAMTRAYENEELYNTNHAKWAFYHDQLQQHMQLMEAYRIGILVYRGDLGLAGEWL